MIEAYEIGAKIVLDDKILGSLDGVDAAFKKVEDAISRTNAMLKDTASLMSGVAGAARSMASSWQAAATAAERMARAAGGVGGGSPGVPGGGGGFGGGGSGPGGFLPLSGPDGSRYLPYGGTDPLQLGYAGGGGTGGGGGGQDAPFNDPGRPNLNLGAGGGLDPMHAMSMVFMAQAAGSMVSSAMRGLTSPAFGVQDQQVNLQNMGATGGDISTAMKTAIQIQKANPGFTIGQSLAMIANLYSVDRNMSQVAALAPTYAQDGYIMSHAQGGADANDQLYSILRSSEDMGKLNLLNKNGSIDTSKAMDFINLYARLVANSNGNLTGAGALTMIGQAGPGATQLSDTALARAIVASQALGPSQVGTGLNAMYQEFIGGKMSQATARSLYEDGVLPKYATINGKRVEMFGDDDKITKPFKYGIGQVMLPPGTLKDEAQALTDPVAWAQQNLFGKYLNSDGTVKKGSEQNVEDLIASLNRDFSRIPGMKLAGNAVFESVVQNRQMANAASLAPLATLHANDAGTASSQAAGFGAALNALMVALIDPKLKQATAVMWGMSQAVNGMAAESFKHPSIAASLGSDALAGITWLGLKASGMIIPGAVGKGATWAAGSVSDVATGPIGAVIAMMQASIVSAKALTDALEKSGLDGRDIAGMGGVGPGSSPTNPVYTHVTNGVPLVSPSPTMPTGPTRPNQAVISRRPGAVNPLISRQ